MRYHSLIVCLDDTPQSHQRLEFALALAASHEAHLTGIYLPPSALSRLPGGLNALIERLDHDSDPERLRRRQDFDATARAHDVSAEWLDLRPINLDLAMRYARLADLVIVGQATRGLHENVLGEDLQEHFLMEAGRPILVTPCMGAPHARLNHIAIAWNGSREAARAVADALPLLERASRVVILTVKESPARTSREHTRIDIQSYLRHHDIEAELIENLGAHEIGDWLLERAGRSGVEADLLVAGAYGHHRLGEHLFGGVTRTLLHEANLPVLMAH